ncbi:hypothetical protein [Lacrimispora xylanisolvens]|uniref:hypothetical protein n=1 Tax=Lacrimispora xylanisolvens TaxID=384636 RepID=UPI002402D4C9
MKDNIGVVNFDDFIFFVNEILSFGENRKTILWDYEIQERLSNKYFNDLDLDKKYEDAKEQEIYYGSIAKHKSEEIKAVKRIIPKDSNTPAEKRFKSRKELESKIERNQSLLSKIHLERNNKQENYRILKYQREEVLKQISDLEIQLGEIKLKSFEVVWQVVNPLYDVMYQNIKHNKICPMCNKDMRKELHDSIINNPNNCFLCGCSLDVNKQDDNNCIANIEQELSVCYDKKSVIENNIYKCEREMAELDNEFSTQESQLFNLRCELRNIEFASSNESQTTGDISIQLIQERIKKLQEDKLNNLNISADYKAQKDNIVMQMDDERRKTNLLLSDTFSQYASAFLGKKAELTYDLNYEDKKMYLPIIEDKIRKEVDHLSESQSFFVDFSFRLSLLNFFYTGPSFFSCETPEGSLDASYEANAANVFLRFLERPNVLILTTNLNNSDFLYYIAKKAKKVSYINLLEYGNLSSVQANNDSIREMSKKVEDIINGKKLNYCQLVQIYI